LRFSRRKVNQRAFCEKSSFLALTPKTPTHHAKPSTEKR
jgi:hypothetical protein